MEKPMTGWMTSREKPMTSKNRPKFGGFGKFWYRPTPSKKRAFWYVFGMKGVLFHRFWYAVVQSIEMCKAVAYRQFNEAK